MRSNRIAVSGKNPSQTTLGGVAEHSYPDFRKTLKEFGKTSRPQEAAGSTNAKEGIRQRHLAVISAV